jgi:hypothetical protein
MALNIFKSGDELFNQGVDLVKRKEYAKARKNFEKTIEKGGADAELANLYVSVIDACLDNNNPERYRVLGDKLEKTRIEAFEFGLTEVESAKVAVECKLLVERMYAARMDGRTQALLEEKGNKLLEVARKYQSQIGNNPIRLSELVGLNVNTGVKEALYIQAWGYEALAAGAVLLDPKKAAELLQNAYNCRRQVGESGEEDLRLVKAYSKSVKCWICGRPATGEGVHFLTMSSDITPYMRSSNDDILQSAPNSYESVYVCRPCYTSISRRSDEISREYHELAMREMRAMEARLRAEIKSAIAFSMTRR